MPLPRPTPGQGKWWGIGIVGVLVMSGIAIWFGVVASSGVQWQDTGNDVVSDTQVQVTFDLTHQNGRSVTCTIEAQDIRHAQVGVTTVKLPPTNLDSVRYTRSVKTITRAVTGTVDSCRYS